MKQVKLTVIAMLLIISGSFNTLSAQQRKADDILGTWLNQEATAKVNIYKEGGKYYGKIVWLKEPNDKITGKPRTDVENPDPKLKNTPLMGLVNLNGFVFDGDDEWEDGTIYDPKNGKTYSCYIQFDDKPNTLRIRGYVGISMLGRTTLWTRTTGQ
jgi:uncharacterized protein (DUF2147 family)